MKKHPSKSLTPVVIKAACILAISGLWTANNALADETQPPNIVFYFCDDLGYADISCYGHPYAKTPSIDKLASEGTSFMQHYATGVTCNPSRTGLMTGIFPARYPRYAADFGFGDRKTITELLKTRGYVTGHFGKWHIGPESNSANGTYGIDEIQVIGNSRDKDAGRDDDLTAAAIDFIKNNADKPFYVNIWGHSTHFPVDTPARLAGQFIEVKVRRDDFSATMQPKFDECIQIGGDLDDSMRQYLGDVYSMDLNVGRVLSTIEELGLEENTIVVFSSDQGPAPITPGGRGAREFSNNMLGYAGIFRGSKHNYYEGGVRIPFIIRWPGKVPAGRIDNTNVTSFVDWMPTLAAITGVKQLPDDLDGEDISDIWLGATRERTKPLLWRTSARNAAPILRDGKWKLHFKDKNGSNVELYDLSNDPTESTNLAAQEKEVVDKMSAHLRSFLSELPEDYEKSGQREPD